MQIFALNHPLFVSKIYLGTNVIIRVIANPSKPMIPKPIAETLDTALNSSMLGFLRRCQTLPHCPKKDTSFSLIAIII